MNVRVRQSIGRLKRRSIEEARRLDRFDQLGFGGKYLRKKPRRELKRYPGIENIQDSDVSDIDDDLYNLEVEEVEPDKYYIIGSIYRYVRFTYKGTEFHATSHGHAALSLNDDRQSVSAWVKFDGMKYSDYIEITSLDDVELDDEEEEALIDQVIKRTHIIDEDDLIQYLESDADIQSWAIEKLSYFEKNECLHRRPGHRAKVSGKRQTSRKPVRQRTIAERYFLRSSGKTMWKLNG